MKRKLKKYPMDGPPRHIQTLMMSPRANHERLAEWLKHNTATRPETAALCRLRK